MNAFQNSPACRPAFPGLDQQAPRSASSNRHANASILVGLLWCLALLSVVVIGVLHTSRLDLMVVKNYGDRIQARYLALAGVEKAKALLYHDAHERKKTSINHTGKLYDDSDQFHEVDLGPGKYSVMRRATADNGGGIVYGVSDEESRLNVNQAPPEEVARLNGITPDAAAAIVDWKDEDNNVSPAGAEAEYYSTLKPPYVPRNGPLQTVRELLMVRGLSRELLLGDDLKQNGLLDSNATSSRNDRSGSSDPGLASVLTVDGSVQNLNAGGEDRINIQTAGESELTSVHGISRDIARAIVAQRGQKKFESLADLLDVAASQNQGRNGARPAGSTQPAAGPKVISEDLFLDVADSFTVQSDSEQPGLVNINTASAEVLACLPGLTPELARAIVSYRAANGFFANIGWLLKVDGLSREVFKQVANRVTARSETFRIISEGKINSSGVRQRIQVIVHVGTGTPKTLSYREDL
jgi:competence ComEA-like helix-hairpin-helix protein